MNTFDVFDTLLARRYLTNNALLQQMETEFSIPGLALARTQADTGTRSLAEIYDHLVATGIIPARLRRTILKREIELEIDNVFPVAQNLQRVAHGDILISDMYLPASAILQMVRSVGLDKQVTLYQSNADKHTGAVWKKFRHYSGVHLGDNKHSDYTMPVQAGINAEHFSPATEPTGIEASLVNNGFIHIGLLSREIRLSSIPKFKDHFELACDFNLPLLFIMAEMIHRQYGERNIVFLGRDCQLLHRLYNAYYDLSYYLPFSRKVAYNQPEDAVKYLYTHAPENPLFVDISSTGGTWAKLQSDIDILVAIYSDKTYYTPDRPVLPKNFKYLTTSNEIGATNLMLEIMNCGDHGHLESIQIHQDQLLEAHFALPELPAELISEVHLPVSRAVQLAKFYKQNIRKEMAKLSDRQLVQGLSQLAGFICSRQDLLQSHQTLLSKESVYIAQICQ